MSSQNPSHEYVDKLISQDAGISQSQLEEFRMQLELSVESLERQAHWTRRVLISALTTVVVCYAIGMIVNLSPTVPWPHEFLMPLWSAVTIAAMITAGVSAARYWATRRPALERARTDLQLAMFRELQHQIIQLNDRLDKQAKA